MLPKPTPTENTIILNPIKIPKKAGIDFRMPNFAPDIMANKLAGPGDILVEKQNRSSDK